MAENNAKTLAVVRVETQPEFAATVEAGLVLLGIDACTWTEEERPEAHVDVFCESREEAESLRVFIDECLTDWAEGECWTSRIVELPAQDWKESWKRFFHAQRVSPRIVVRPPWEAFDARQDDCVIEIDPGMSFGTGQHGTTKACLAFIDRLAGDLPGASCLDAGCGSGILSIAAAKLGMSPVMAIDHDPDAVRIAGENFAKNGVADLIDTRALDVRDLGCLSSYDVVIANILSDVLLANAPSITAAVRPGPGAHLVLAGILTTQYEDVFSHYVPLGFREVERRGIDEWTSGLFRRT